MAMIGTRRAVLLGRIARNYLFRDYFGDARAAGTLNGTPADPGPGVRTVTDTGSKLSLSGGQAVFAGGNIIPAWGDPGMWGETAIMRAAGRAFLAQVTPYVIKNFQIGFDTDKAAVLGANAFNVGATGNVASYDTGAVRATLFTMGAAAYQLLVVLRVRGAHYLARGGVFAQWTLLWSSDIDATSVLYPGMSNYDGAFTADDLNVFDFPAPWTQDPCAAFSRLTNPVATNTTNAPAGDAVLNYTFTYSSAADTYTIVRFRKQDATNYWYVYSTPVGSINLRQVSASVGTDRGSAASVFTNGVAYRVTVVASGSIYTVFVNGVQKVTYTDPGGSLTTMTTVEVENVTGGPISELTTRPWPLPNGIATSYLLCPQVNATASMTSDAVIEFTFTFAGISAQLNYRVVDTSNRWQVYIDPAGALRLYDKVAGVETQRSASADGTVTAGIHRIVIIVQGNVHTVYLDNMQKLTYTDPNNYFLTATVLHVNNVSGGFQEVAAWPRFPSLPAGV